MENMSRNGYTATEPAQCVLWIAEKYVKTAVKRQFMKKCEKSPPARSTIQKCFEAYQSRES